MKHYKFLEKVFAKICHLGDVVRMLCLSSLDVESRVHRVCTLQEIRQEILDSDMVSDAIGTALSNKGQLSDWEVANLHCMNRMYKCLRGIPVDLMHNLFKVRVECKSKWASFCLGEEPIQNVLECFADVIKLSSEMAAVKAEDLGVSNKYDVMLSIC
ncbi:MAG: carboxypeptidase, partial [Anaplasma sp.]